MASSLKVVRSSRLPLLVRVGSKRPSASVTAAASHALEDLSASIASTEVMQSRVASVEGMVDELVQTTAPRARRGNHTIPSLRTRRIDASGISVLSKTMQRAFVSRDVRRIWDVVAATRT
ncbi:hypothetical protein AcV7_009175 [Taiwanofungus camphoratus]|nr:hypothetical protein AcW2_004281 [Antrodia cinnamomea]KAI0948428.1 hypothetical protein AcV7_009175 [Antrodia cinnamomea]